MSNGWLSHPTNQEILLRICRQSIEEIAPEEAQILDEIFPKYIALRQEGEVRTGTEASKAFGFAGEGELITLVILPVLVELLAALLVKQSRERIDELKLTGEAGAEQDVAVDEIEEKIDGQLQRDRRHPSLRRRIAEPLARTFVEQVEGG